MKPSERHWPVQQAPDDFADRVVEAGLRAAHVEAVEVETSVGHSPTWSTPPVFRTGRGLLSIFGRAAWGWGFAAALAVGGFVLYLGAAKPEANAERDAIASERDLAKKELAEAKAAMARQAREIEELSAKVAALNSELDDKPRAELKAKLASVQQRAQAGAAAPVSSTCVAGCQPTPPRVRPKAKAACDCQPGDALCSCL